MQKFKPNKKPFLTVVIALLCIFSLGILSSKVLADGNATLGPAGDFTSITIEDGSGIVAAGTGLMAGPNVINITIPSGATVNQVLLYWSVDFQNTDPTPATDTITVDGTPVTGDFIGEEISTKIGPQVAYRAEISKSLISDGLLTVGGLPPTRKNYGAGLLVIIDDGSGAANIEIRDGNDYAWARNPDNDPDNIFINPQEFTFASSSSDRTASLDMFFSSVSDDGLRPTAIEITVKEGLTTVFSDELLNELGSHDGAEWDTLTVPVNIPAGATTLTVQAFSESRPAGAGGNPASFSWITAGLSVPEPGTAFIGDTVFCDANGNGVQDEGEDGIEGVEVSVACNFGFSDNTVTDVSGEYEFEVPANVDCSVSVGASTSPDCNQNGTCPDTVAVDPLAPGDSFLDADFCFTPPCSECDGKVTQLTLQNNGPTADIVVTQKGGKKQPDIVVFAGNVPNGGQFTFDGEDKNGTFGKEIKIFVGSTETKIHTSCSRPIGPGSVFGDFLVIEAFSRHGGLICPDGDGDGEFDCRDAKPITSLSLIWNGPGPVDIVSEGGEVFSNIANGDLIVLNTAGLGNDVDVSISGAVSGSSRFHVSCSDEEMNGPEDCGSNQGNGKDNKSSRINDWIFEGMAGNLTLECP